MTLIIAHAGYPWVEETIMVGLYSANVYVDISTLNQIEEAFGSDVILSTLRKLSSSLGTGRMLFGSDWIYNLEEMINAVNKADFLSERDKENILGKNAKELLKL
jgi:predicted TIM-barrel fold metal-dependent hydrolase